MCKGFTSFLLLLCSIGNLDKLNWGTAILRVIFIELCRRVRVKFPKSSANIHKS